MRDKGYYNVKYGLRALLTATMLCDSVMSDVPDGVEVCLLQGLLPSKSAMLNRGHGE